MAEISIALDATGKIAAYQAAHKGPPMQDDRPIGAILAGLPTIDAPKPGTSDFIHTAEMSVADTWVYGGVPNVDEHGFGTFQIGERESPIGVGLRDHSMRIDHVDSERFKAILERLRVEAGWETRPSPAKGHSAKGQRVVRGQGVSIMLRDNGYWACACMWPSRPPPAP